MKRYFDLSFIHIVLLIYHYPDNSVYHGKVYYTCSSIWNLGLLSGIPYNPVHQYVVLEEMLWVLNSITKKSLSYIIYTKSNYTDETSQTMLSIMDLHGIAIMLSLRCAS